MLSRPNFYYEIHRKVRDVNGDTWALIYRSQRCMETLNPLWPEVTLGLYPCLNYYNFENCGKDMEKEMGERWSKVDVKITLIDSASSTSSLFHASSTSTGNSSSSSSVSKKKRTSLTNNAAVLGTVTTTLQSLLSLTCAKGCNMSLQKSLHITRNGTICGQLVIVSADIKHPQKNANVVDVMNEQMGKLSCSTTASLPSAPVAPSMDHGTLFLNSSAPPLFATAIREGDDESAPPHSSVSVSLHPPPRITSFDEYIRNGSKLELCVAIDFTNNNGLDWNTPDNAHYHSSSSSSSSDSNVGSEDDNVSMITTATGGGKRRMNNYEFILSTIGSVVSNLNNDGVGSIDADNYNNSEIDIPMWGFGADFEGRQYNIFQCGNVTKAKKDQNGNNGSSRRNVIVNHLLNTYHDTFECFPTLGPTDTNGVVYDGVIGAAMSHANKRKKYAKEHGGGELSYTLLVILTTGSKDDVMRCKEHLVDAMMKSPLSVLFISVGKENGANNFQRLEPNDHFLLKEYMSRQQQQQQKAGFGGGIGKRRSFLTFVEGTDWHVPHRDAKSLARVAFQHVSDQVVEYFSLN